MNYKELLMEKIEVIQLTQYKTKPLVKLYINPSNSMIQSLFKTNQSIRGIIDFDTFTLYIWEAYYASHIDIKNALSLQYSDTDFLYIKYQNNEYDLYAYFTGKSNPKRIINHPTIKRAFGIVNINPKKDDSIMESITSTGYKPGYYLNIEEVEKLSYSDIKLKLSMELNRIKKIFQQYCHSKYSVECDEILNTFLDVYSNVLNENKTNESDLMIISLYLNRLKDVLRFKHPRLAFKIKNLQIIIKRALTVNI